MRTSFEDPRVLNRTARPRGCGCVGCLTQSALVLLAGCGLLYLMLLLLAPWNFYFGGRFHVVPGWTGGGWLHDSTAGGNYYLWLRFEPTIPGYRKSPLKGDGYLCSPKGEKFRLHFGGDMPRDHGKDLRGVPIHLYLYSWPLLANFSGGDRRPSFDLYGAFGNSELVMDDRGSLTRAFRPDGTLRAPHDRRAWVQPSTPVTLHENAAWWIFNPSCPASPQ